MNRKILEERLLRMVEEDEGVEDVTSALMPNKTVKAEIIAKEDGFISGVFEVGVLFNLFNITVTASASDGEALKKQQKVFILSGRAQDILLTERTALNILSRMSGITSLTRGFLLNARKANPGVRISATRKTTPLFSYFEKKAVLIGGGDTHRAGLYDMILIKDNHIKLFEDVRETIVAARKGSFTHKIEVEVRTPEDAVASAEEKADIIMLDNMSVEEVKETISRLKERGLRGCVLVEVSGGITLENISEYAACGPDIVSVGRLTHSVEAKDFTLKIL